MPSGKQFDYVIVGAGSAGCVLANRLTEDEACRILLMEAGGEARTRLCREREVSTRWFLRTHGGRDRRLDCGAGWPSMTSSSALESVLKRDRLIVIAGLVAVASLAWAYTLSGVGMDMNAFEMTAMSDTGLASSSPVPWSPAHALAVFLMWFVMMIAMMLPSAAPMVLLYIAITRKRQTQPRSEIGAAVFAAGYLVIWGIFSAGVALAQWAFEMSRLLTPMMRSTNALFDGVLLLAAGIYQLTPLKQACLGRCRQPVSFITRYWRSGTAGAFRMGIAHGTFCLGCCWFLMALLFFGGVMNLYWIAGVATYVLVEKIIPHQRWLSHAAGWVLIVLAASILARAVWGA